MLRIGARVEVEHEPFGRRPRDDPTELDLVAVARSLPESAAGDERDRALRVWQVAKAFGPPVRGTLREQRKGACGGATEVGRAGDHSSASSSSRRRAASQNSSRKSRTDASPWARTA